MQVSSLFLEAGRQGRELVGVRVRAARGMDHGRVRPQHVQVVQLAEDFLHRLEAGHEARRRRQAQLADELEGVAQPLGFDPHRVDALDDEDRAGHVDRLVQPPRLIDGSPDQDLARVPGHRAAALDVLEAADALPQPIEEALRPRPVHRLAQAPQGGRALGFEMLPQRGQTGIASAAGAIGEAGEGDVELAQRPERARQLLQPLHQPAALAAAERQRDRLAQPPRGDARLVHRVDVALQRRRQIVVERAHTTIEDVGQRRLDPVWEQWFGWGRGTA